MSAYRTVYARQGDGNGPMNINNLHDELSDVNPDVIDVINPIKRLKSSDVRTAINIIACREKRQQISKDNTKEEEKAPSISAENLALAAREAMENGEIEEELER